MKESNEEKTPQSDESRHAQREKTKKMIIYPLMVLICAASIYFIFAPSAEEKAPVQDGFNTEIPMPKGSVMTDDKKSAYEQAQSEQKKRERTNSMQDLASMFGEEEDLNLLPEDESELRKDYGDGSSQANAKRSLPGMRGIEVRGGFVDGVQKPVDYYLGAGFSTYTKNGNRWVFGAEYLTKEYAYKNISIPKAQITAEGGYYVKFLSDHSKIVFLSIGGSALAGYETSNWDNKLLPDGATLRNKDAFIYGGAITLELETDLSDRVVLLLNARERILWGSSIGKLHTVFGAGIKIIIN